jgi:hypothetical protein
MSSQQFASQASKEKPAGHNALFPHRISNLEAQLAFSLTSHAGNDETPLLLCLRSLVEAKCASDLIDEL